MNDWIGIGNLTKDVEERVTSEGLVIASFTIAINDGYGEKKTTDYIPVKAFGKTAENCIRYLSKGKKCAVQGKVKTGSYTNKDGQKVYTTDVVSNRVEFLEWGDKAETKSTEPQEGIPAGFQVIDDDDIPF